MDAYELILKRRTIRKFRQKKIGRCILAGCLEAARLAPSARNLQPLEYVLVTRKGSRGDVFSCTAWAGYEKKAGPKRGEEPAAYVVILSNRSISETAAYDVGLAAGNIMLAALNAGVASCPLGALDRPRLASLLGIPATHAIELAIALGYPKQKSVAEDLKDDVKYWLDGAGVLHVPKRKPDGIAHWERF